MAHLLRRIAIALLVCVLLSAVVTIATIERGRAALKESDAAFDEGRLRDSIAFARRSALAYVPGAPHVGDAYERLAAIGVGAEASGHRDVAREAWEAARAAALGTRHLWQPHPGELERANRSLARLLSQAATSEERGREVTEELLRQGAITTPARAAALVAGFVLALVGLALLVVAGVGPDGRIVRRRSWVAAALTALGVLSWALAAYRA